MIVVEVVVVVMVVVVVVVVVLVVRVECCSDGSGRYCSCGRIQLLATTTLLLRVDATMHTQRLQEDTAIGAHTDLI